MRRRVSKATHRGTCQACGRVQMLPNNLLSNHGYTVEWSCFVGTCQGSRRKPFEISKDYIDHCIMWAERAIEGLEREKAELLARDDARAWRHYYVERSGYGKRSRYEWREGRVVINREPDKYPYVWHGDAPVTNSRGHQPKMPVEPLHCIPFEVEKTPQAIARWLNEQYVRQVIDAAIANNRRYVAWQRERTKNWKPQPLLPLLDEQEQESLNALAALQKAGAERRPSKLGSCLQQRWEWWLGKRYLGHNVPSAYAALQKPLAREE